MKQNKIIAAILILIMAALTGIVIFSFLRQEETPPNDMTNAESTDNADPFEIATPAQTSPTGKPGNGSNQDVTGELHIDAAEQTDKKEPYIVGEIIIIPGVSEE